MGNIALLHRDCFHGRRQFKGEMAFSFRATHENVEERTVADAKVGIEGGDFASYIGQIAGRSMYTVIITGV